MVFKTFFYLFELITNYIYVINYKKIKLTIKSYLFDIKFEEFRA